MAFDPELAMRQLQSVYSRAYMDLLEHLARAPTRAAANYERQLLVNLEATLTRLDNTSRQFAEQAIPRMYQQAITETNNYWRRHGLQPPLLRTGFARVHESAVEALAGNFYDNMRDAHNYVGRRVRGVWRNVQLEVTLEQVSKARTFDEAHSRFVAKVLEDGLGAFRDKGGRIWRLDAYAEMSVRTVRREATNVGMVNQLRGMGRDLLQLSSHMGACAICADLEGRVYSISGQDERYPPLSEAFGAYNTVHPNCKHVLTPYIEAFDDDPADTLRQSNREHEDDPRTAEEKAAYEESQERAARRREARRAAEEEVA